MNNNFYKVVYKLYATRDGQRSLSEERTVDDPFEFISGFGATIQGFASQVEKLSKGDSFDFTIPSNEAFGEYVKERIIKLDKSVFQINGKFAESIIYEGAIIPLQNADGNNFMGRVVSISETQVTVDLNHPLAGCDLQFIGEVLDCHEATNEEIQKIVNSLSGGGCGGCGGGCHGCGNGDSNCGECGCDNGGCKSCS